MLPRFPRRIARLFIPGALALGILLLLLGAGNDGDTADRELIYVPGRLSPSRLRLAVAPSLSTGQKRPGVATATTTTTTLAPLPGVEGEGRGGGGGGGKVLLQRLGSVSTVAAALLGKAGSIRPRDIVNPHPFSYLINPGESACRSTNSVVKAQPSPSKDSKGLRSNNGSDSSNNNISDKNSVTGRTWDPNNNNRTLGGEGDKNNNNRTQSGQNRGNDHHRQGRESDPAAGQGSVWLLVYVHSAPANLKKRQSIRQTWGQPSVLKDHNATLVFILGAQADPRIQEQILLESERYGDLVQENFNDTYHNLTFKAIAGLKWAATFCSRASFILKTDDDILVNLYTVVKHLRTVVTPQYGTKRIILCNRWNYMKIIRDKKSKWYVPESEFPGEYFPTYCSGSAFLLSGDMAQLMYEASLVTPFFWVDDYYITGALIQRLAVKHQAINQAYSLNPAVATDKFRKDTKGELFFFHLHNLRVMYGLWMNMTHLHHLSSSVSKPSSASSLTSH